MFECWSMKHPECVAKGGVWEDEHKVNRKRALSANCKKCNYWYTVQWQKRNPGFGRANRLVKSRGDLTQEQWEFVVNKCGGVCLVCKDPNITVDHILPLCRRGRHSVHNVQPLCLSCNSSKGRDSDDYRPVSLRHLVREVWPVVDVGGRRGRTAYRSKP